jgi:hypothetical protein
MTRDQLDLLMQRAAELPEEEQAELAQSIFQRLYHVEDDKPE